MPNGTSKRRNTWTFGDPNAKGEPFQLPVIQRAIVTGTQVRYVDPALLLVTDVKVDTIRAGGTTITDNRINFTGDGTLRGKPFTMNGGILSPNSTVTFGRTKLVLHAQSGPTLLDVNGTLPAATQIEGSDLNVTVRGPNLARLFDFLGVAVPDTRRYRFNSQADQGGRRVALHPAERLLRRQRPRRPDDDLAAQGPAADRRRPRLEVGRHARCRAVRRLQPERSSTRRARSGTITRVNGTPRLLPDAPLRADALADLRRARSTTRSRASAPTICRSRTSR